jgi:hypothetical protein
MPPFGFAIPATRWSCPYQTGQRAKIVPGRDQGVVQAESATAVRAAAAVRMSWARRLKRVFAIDIERCEQCGGRVRIIAALEDPEVIEKILRHLGLED